MPPARQKNTLLADFQIHTLDWFYIDTGWWSCDATRPCLLPDLVTRVSASPYRIRPRLQTSFVPSTMSTADSVDPIVANALASIELLTPKDIPNLDDFCPICLLTFRAVLESRKDNIPGMTDVGVARVGGCGHLFCAEE